MRKYSLGINTNVWNALRYALFTLLLVPLAEKLWALTHSKRTGKRIMCDRKARLRGSRLAHWGLHQEVDENSRLSKISAISVCVLHIAGALLLEYGSASVETHVLQDAILSRTLSDEGDLKSNGIYFFDAEYVFGLPYGSIDCIDGEPRSLKDFGLELKRKQRTKIVPFADIPVRRNADRQADYYVRNCGLYFQMFDNGSSQWYEQHSKTAWNLSPEYIDGFSNKSVSCEALEWGFLECYENQGEAAKKEFIAAILTDYFVTGTRWTRLYRRQGNTRISTILNRVSVSSDTNPSRQAEALVHTLWVRIGMPRVHTSRSNFMHLNLNITKLRNGCGHMHAIPVSNLRKLEGLKVSRATFPNTRHIWKGDHKLIVWRSGDRLALGTLTHSKNEYCAVRYDVRLCVTLIGGGKHELALYSYNRRKGSFEEYEKVFNISFQGILRKRDLLDLAVQACAEAFRPDPFTRSTSFADAEKRIFRLMRSDQIVSGLVRVEGNGILGKSTVRRSDIATINILGLVGTSILVVLVAAPIIPMLFFYRHCIVADIESSFRRAVMEIDGVRSCRAVPDRAPSIVSKDVGDGAPVISHTYKM